MPQDRVSCENGNEPSGSMRCGRFLDRLGDYQLLCSMEFIN